MELIKLIPIGLSARTTLSNSNFGAGGRRVSEHPTGRGTRRSRPYMDETGKGGRKGVLVGKILTGRTGSDGERILDIFPASRKEEFSLVFIVCLSVRKKC